MALSDVARTRRLQVFALGAVLLGLAVVLGPVGGMLSTSSRPFAIVFVGALLVPVLFWRVLASPVIVCVVAATSIERFPDAGADAITAKIPLFRSVADSFGLSGVIATPYEMLLILALLIWLARGISDRRIHVQASPLGIGVLVLVGIALAMELYGLARGAIFNISLWELRPFLYLGATYLLASQLISRRAALEGILWGMVVGTGLKGVEGTERVFTMASVVPKPEAILEHDESFFFSVFIVLVLLLWIYRKRGYLRGVATVFLPFVLTADLGNNRRAAWVMLPAMLLAVALVAYVRAPARRKAIAWTVCVLLVVGAAYVLAFKSSTSLEGQPAHAIWSQFQPDPRDANSNLYRQQENADLAIDIRASVFTGTGFGLPIAHPIPLFYDASGIDPLINFIPHNNILYVWLRLGMLGAVAFWWMIGAAVVAASRLARYPDRDYAIFGTLALTAVMAWLVQGYLDIGIASFRIVTVVGCLLGAVAAAQRMAAREAEQAATEQPVTVRVVPYRVPRVTAGGESSAASWSSLP